MRSLEIEMERAEPSSSPSIVRGSSGVRVRPKRRTSGARREPRMKGRLRCAARTGPARLGPAQYSTVRGQRAPDNNNDHLSISLALFRAPNSISLLFATGSRLARPKKAPDSTRSDQLDELIVVDSCSLVRTYARRRPGAPVQLVGALTVAKAPNANSSAEGMIDGSHSRPLSDWSPLRSAPLLRRDPAQQ